MSGMQSMSFSFGGGRASGSFRPVLVGVVASGNLEVLIEAASGTAESPHCHIDVETSARGFDRIWEAVLQAFHERHGLAGVRVSINDMGATPAVVSLRLDQAVATLKAGQR